MSDVDCVQFLQWALPRLGLRWAGIRRVRKQVCKRIARRVALLGIDTLAEYRAYLQQHPAAWSQLDSMCRIVISRFFRDRMVFEFISTRVLPALALDAVRAGRNSIDCWCGGSASGEEAYSLNLAWQMGLATRFPALRFRIIGTDAHAQVLERARQACYPDSSLKELPVRWRATGFQRREGRNCVRAELRANVEFHLQDIRVQMPLGPFDLILCRNLAFTYFDPPMQTAILAQLEVRLRPAGALVIGVHETLPAGSGGLRAWPGTQVIFRKNGAEDVRTQLSALVSGI